MSLEKLAELSDILIVFASLNESTKHIIDATFLTNTSRGGLVDQEALVDALTLKKISGKQ